MMFFLFFLIITFNEEVLHKRWVNLADLSWMLWYLSKFNG